MTPKDKANQMINELFDRSLAYHDAHIAAKYSIEVIIEAISNAEWSDATYYRDNAIEYWEKVKNEMK